MYVSMQRTICTYSEVNPNSRYKATGQKCIVFKADEKACFSDPGITNQHNLKQSVTK